MPADLDGIAGAVEVYTGGEKQTKEQEDQVIWESKPVQRAPFTSRRLLDVCGPHLNYLQECLNAPIAAPHHHFQTSYASSLQLLPPAAYVHCPATSQDLRYAATIPPRGRSAINNLVWTPDGRRLYSASNSGMLVYWNAQSFTSDNQMQLVIQAPNQPPKALRCVVFSHNAMLLLTCDDLGTVKLLQSNMEPFNSYAAHKEPVRAVSWSPSDVKFCTASDDTTVKVWDLIKGKEQGPETVLQGHGGDVRWVEWHPWKGLLASASRDSSVKLWDPRTHGSGCVATLHGHKQAVNQVHWNMNGNWLLSCSKDQSLKVYDIRMQKEMQTFQGHEKEVTSCAWHPVHEETFASGSYDGCLSAWSVRHEDAQDRVLGAHEGAVWTLAWHALGHVLASAGQDARIQLWCRHRPGDLLDDRYSTGISAAYGPGMLPHETGVSHGLGLADHKPAAARASVIPGVGAVKEQLGTQQGEQSTLDAKALAAAISVAQHISQQHATGPPGIGSSGRGDAHFHAGGMKRMRPSDDRFEGPSSSHMRGPPSQQHRRDFTPPPGAIGALAPPGPPAGPPPPMRGPKPPQPMHHPSGPGPMGHPPPGSGPMGPAPSRYPPPLGGVPHRGGPPPAGHPDYRERDRGPPPYGQHPDMGPPPYGRPGHPQHGGPPMHAGPPFNGPPPHGPPGPPGRPMGPPPGPPGQGQGPVPGQGQGRGARPPPPQRSFR